MTTSGSAPEGLRRADFSTTTTGTVSTDSTLKPSTRAEEDRTLRARPWRRKCNRTPWSVIVNHTYKGAGTTEDPYAVSWLTYEEGERENPYHWAEGYKWACTMMAATGAFNVTMGSSILSAAINSIKHDMPGYSSIQYIMVTCIYILGFTVGPFIWAPCSEVIGRRSTFLWTFVPYTIFNACICASPNLHTFLGLRFCAGMFGCSTMTNSGAIIADSFTVQKRGLAMGMFAAMPFLGPAVGPIAGGFLSQSVGWKWVAAIPAFFSAALWVIELLFLPETFAPKLLRRRARMLSEATGQVYLCAQDVEKPLDTIGLFKKQLRVPLTLLLTEPIVFILSLYVALIFSILYLQFTSYPLVFQVHRHWSPGIAGLAFLGTATGSNLGLAYIILWGNPSYARKHRKMGYLPPEARLGSAMVGAIMIPIGLFWFAWTCVPVHIHWILPVLSSVPFGCGMVLLFLASNNYLVDTYLPYAASVMAGGTVLRSLFGGVLPLFTLDMYNALGTNWAGTLIAFLSVAFVPVPFLLRIYGRRIRRLTKPGREADDIGLKMAAAHASKQRGEQAESAPPVPVGSEKPGVAHVENVENVNSEGENIDNAENTQNTQEDIVQEALEEEVVLERVPQFSCDFEHGDETAEERLEEHEHSRYHTPVGR